jgi:hypothetical protein
VADLLVVPELRYNFAARRTIPNERALSDKILNDSSRLMVAMFRRSWVIPALA